MNTDPQKLVEAQQAAETRSLISVTVAIVTLPITFGTINGHKTALSKLETLQHSFDYVFIIGNHILQKPVAAAPRLAASSRAVKYVRACIDGLMLIVWSAGGSKTRSAFLKIFPPKGFAIIGRASTSSANEDQENVLFGAVSGMLNEQLPLHHAKRVALIAPRSIINEPRTEQFFMQAAFQTRDEVMSIETGSRPAATILAFGIAPVQRNQERFRQFCLQLLDARKFDIPRNSDAHVIARLAARTIFFAFLSHDGSIDHIFKAAKKSRVAVKFVLTNFTPPLALVERCSELRINIFHFSMLDEFLTEAHTQLR